MKLPVSVLLAGALLAQLQSASSPSLRSFHYSRSIVFSHTPEGSPSNACVLLDGEVFAHAAATLSDVRLFDASGKVEIPYAVTLSSSAGSTDNAAVVDTVFKTPGQLTFDLQMPARPYSAVDLTLNARNFVASAHVTGLRSRNDAHPVFLGDFTLYDLTNRRLGSDTHLSIAESMFPELKIALVLRPAGSPVFSAAPAILSAQIPPDRQEQTLYSSVAENSELTQASHQSVATFQVAAHIPVERVTFTVDPEEKTSFSRGISIAARPSGADGVAGIPPETLSGEISRVHLDLAGDRIAHDSLSVPAILASNAQSPARVQVAIEDGDQPPLKIQQIRLEMRQRKLCFPATAGSTLTLAYGSPTAQAPVYDFARSFNASVPAGQAMLMQERTNTFYVSPAKSRTRFNRSPAFLGLSILLAVCLLAVIAYRALHRGHHNSLRR